MKTTYGYEAAPNGLLQVIPEQAAVVHEIYRQYLSGKSLGGIADFLFEKGTPSPSGKERWSRSVLNAILSNQYSPVDQKKHPVSACRMIQPTETNFSNMRLKGRIVQIEFFKVYSIAILVK